MAPNHITRAKPDKTVLEAAAEILREVGKPLHAQEIAQAILNLGSAKLSGHTPWKTVTSRLSTDIRNKQELSIFQRDGHARFALREWGIAEFLVNRRRINPIDETIQVVPIDRFQRLLARCRPDPFYRVKIEALVRHSQAMKRATAEETAQFVQLIPTFVVRRKRQLLTYKRTKRLPEARLHNSRCVSFGGHMQVDDLPNLFAPSYRDPQGPMFRELYEELSFSEPVTPRYIGVLYLTGSAFEQQHAGIVFEVSLSQNNRVVSLETTMHTDVKFSDISKLASASEELDSWSTLLINSLNA